MTVVAPG